MPGKKVRSEDYQARASILYMSGYSVDAVAKALGIDYRTARKAITSQTPLRDPHARLVGRTRPDRKVKNEA
jgi:transposase